MSGRRRGRPAGADEIIDDSLVLDAALAAFGDRGFEGMSVRELSRALDCSHNLIPQRFGSKEKLWYAAIDRGFELLARELLEVTAKTADDDVRQLRSQVVRFIEVNASRPALLRVIHAEASSPGPRLDYLFEKYIEPVRAFGEETLARLHKSGAVRLESVMLMYFMMTHGAGGPSMLPALAERFGGAVDPTDPQAVRMWAEHAASMIFDGLLAGH